jgi:hypothetical protein
MEKTEFKHFFQNQTWAYRQYKLINPREPTCACLIGTKIGKGNQLDFKPELQTYFKKPNLINHINQLRHINNTTYVTQCSQLEHCV